MGETEIEKKWQFYSQLRESFIRKERQFEELDPLVSCLLPTDCYPWQHANGLAQIGFEPRKRTSSLSVKPINIINVH